MHMLYANRTWPSVAINFCDTTFRKGGAIFMEAGTQDHERNTKPNLISPGPYPLRTAILKPRLRS